MSSATRIVCGKSREAYIHRLATQVASRFRVLVLVGCLLFAGATLCALAPADSSALWRPSEPHNNDLNSKQQGVEGDQPRACSTLDTARPCRVYLPAIARPAVHYVALPIGLNAGGEAVTLTSGLHFQADQPYSPSSGMGYIDGLAVTTDWDWEPIDGTVEDALYRTGRTGITAYRFNVPPDTYLVHLKFAEIRQHGPGFRVFDVYIEHARVLRSLDIYEHAQHDYALDYRFPAEVMDRSLDVTFVGTIGEPILSGIWIDKRQPDTTPPPIPAGLTAVGGYGEIILDWVDVADDDLAGYQIFRAQQATGPFIQLNTTTGTLSRFIDRATNPATKACYRVAAADVFGNVSGLSPAVCAAATTTESASLPYFRLQISESNLRKLNSKPAANDYVPAILEYGGLSYPVETHYRGNMSRWCNKKSWKIRFKGLSPFPGSDVMLLNGECHDPTLIKEAVTYDLMQDVGVRSGTTRFVLLQLNDHFIGVYTQVENPDVHFLERTGRNPDGNLYKCDDGLDLEPDCANQIHESRDATDLYNFAALVNNTADSEFAWAIAQALDVKGFLNYVAVKALIGEPDSTYSYLLYHDTSSELWEVLPWDNNAGFHLELATLPVDYGSVQHPDYAGRHNVLITRVLAVPQFRAYYSERLAELSANLFSEAAMAQRFDSALALVQADAERDLWKLHREDNATARADTELLASFVRARNSYLRGALPDYAPPQTTYLYLNEAMASNTTALVDPADDQAEPWLELHNAGLDAVDLGGMYLTNDLGAPTRFRIPSGTTVPGLGYIAFWLDGEPEQGLGHTSFTLPAHGGPMALFDRDGSGLLDLVDLPALPADISWARFPDGRGRWQSFTAPSPGASNILWPPIITDVQHWPANPLAGSQPVLVTARVIGADGRVDTVDLVFRGDHEFVTTPMADDGLHGDGVAGDAVFGALLPAYAPPTEVQYYIRARDDRGRSAQSPVAAPTLTYRFRVGFVPTPVHINELMAANDTTIEDPDETGAYPDWIELHNPSDQLLKLGGMYLTDELPNPNRFRIPSSVSIPPQGFVIFWADDDPTQGPTHTNFKLSASSEAVGLFAADGATLIDAILFTSQQPDVSLGRCPDGTGNWRPQFIPTPGHSNACWSIFLPR